MSLAEAEMLAHAPGGDQDGGRRKPRFQRRACAGQDAVIAALGGWPVDQIGRARMARQIRKLYTICAGALEIKTLPGAVPESVVERHLLKMKIALDSMESEYDRAIAPLIPLKYKALLTFLSDHDLCTWNDDIEYDVCSGCSLVFRGEHKDSTTCPRCERSRETAKTLIYRSLSGWVRSLFQQPQLAAQLNAWRGRKSAPGDAMRDIIDGNAWAKEIENDPIMKKDDRNIAVGLITDPFQVAKDDMKYSVTPLMAVTPNLPQESRMCLGTLRMVFLLCGTNEDKVKVDPYDAMSIVVDELRYLYEYGVDVCDASKPETAMRCKRIVVFDCSTVVGHLTVLPRRPHRPGRRELLAT